MIPLYRSSKMEPAVNLLAKHFRHVVVDAAYWCRPAIRAQADKMQARVYFDRTQSQITAWQSTGGVLVRWDKKTVAGPYDAIFYAECPRSIEFLDRYAQEARWLSVVYVPPAWRVHFDNAEVRTRDKPEKKRREVLDGLERVKQLLDAAPPFTSDSLARLLLAHRGQIVPPLSAPVLLASAARGAGTAAGAP